VSTDRVKLFALWREIEDRIQEVRAGIAFDGVDRVARESELLDKQRDVELLIGPTDLYQPDWD
jgi:hypothetical protein